MSNSRSTPIVQGEEDRTTWLRRHAGDVKAFLIGAVSLPILALAGAKWVPVVALSCLAILIWPRLLEEYRLRRVKKVQELVWSADHCRNKRDWTESLLLLEQAEALARSLHFKRDFNLGAVLQRKSHVALHAGELEMAYNAALECLEIAKRIQDPKLRLLPVELTVAQILLAREEYEPAAKILQRALPDAARPADTTIRIFLLTLLSSANHGLRRPSEARNYLNEAERWAVRYLEAKPATLVHLSIQLGADRMCREEFLEAKGHFDRAMQLQEREEADSPVMANILTSLAKVEEELGFYESAEQFAHRAFAIVSKSENPDPFLRSTLAVTLASICSVRRDMKAAGEWLKLALEAEPKYLQALYQFESRVALARWELKAGQVEQASENFRIGYQSLQSARHLESPLIAKGMAEDAKSLEEAGRKDEAQHLRDWSGRIRKEWTRL